MRAKISKLLARMAPPCPVALFILLDLFAVAPAFSADKYYDYGMALSARKQYRQAISYFDASIKCNSPQKAQSWFRKADCLELLNDRNGALSAYTRVLELAPSSQEALFARARINILSLAKQKENAPPKSCPILRAEKEGRKAISKAGFSQSDKTKTENGSLQDKASSGEPPSSGPKE